MKMTMISSSVASEKSSNPLTPADTFLKRHVGSDSKEVKEMLATLGYESLDAMINTAVPANIRLKNPIQVTEAKSEYEVLQELKRIFSKNKIFKNYIGTGFNDCIVPAVIQRNILENPGWYTAYTPYQAEIAQGRLEALLNFQTMIMDMTGLEIANASLLDESTAAAEAITLCHAVKSDENGDSIFISDECHPQTIDVVRTRAIPVGFNVVVGDYKKFKADKSFFAVLIQYPATNGNVYDYEELIKQAHANGVLVVTAADLMSLAILKSPGELGADVAVGSTQRFGLPLGFGGPHAGYLATKEEYKRSLPGRLIGVSKDSQGAPAMRLSLQTREQHIRRDKATSNICTAQVLLAVLSSMYAVYHGPEGIRHIATRIHLFTSILAKGIESLGFKLNSKEFFDTLSIAVDKTKQSEIRKIAESKNVNLRYEENWIGISIDETVGKEDILVLLSIFNQGNAVNVHIAADTVAYNFSEKLVRKSEYLTHPVFNTYHTETKLLRYIRKLESRDVSLTHSMIPLGSCTMKLNASTEMLPLTWPEVSKLHPFAPIDQTLGYREMFSQLEKWLCEITGFKAISLQPNAGSQGEYAGLLAIRDYHLSKNQGHRTVCLIPTSAHGTNPASAVMAGFKVVVTACDENGNIDVSDLKEKAEKYKNELGALMITYPSTHGVFEATIKEICEIIHTNGGQVYMDGANMNAQVGLTSPGEIGADVCHLNLHKTFCIPHGGGGPGVGPIGVASHLVPFLPGHALVENGSKRESNSVTSAPWGSASITTISWIYIAMLGGEGLTYATKMAILNANYIAKRLESYFPVLYRGNKNLVAHECIIDVRRFKATAKIEVDDIAKRLIDFGFHAPTMSWPVPGTLMIEPTESESKEELDRFCEAMIQIHREITDIENKKLDEIDNPLKNSPHTAKMVMSDKWDHLYSRELAAYPLPYLKEHKYWPVVGRVDNVYGDRNLVCACLPIDSYNE
ncbi:MAG TPA: aminomethyl-transferring glycine dehydrogenase [Leptospiraceae bacterium]|nr:aminomethyl-transferring glycine dehydrogenase [Leptospiraceae bacterium]HMW07911.1 aminomethyl-transferring glycine dehydrogenase [Leptospiraceae bacterium]HMX32063.1 aminomethyl-transferring glycine dehydrogenase [Leptospiraceae bacterium]HMY31174.1 aminomethyl-transferring glycine dehydrogenase [Leptospiraceae bacterium]HMZ65405.1 aminomethyl-transferring glycine dehydrogenase [Leptospiraceae bacterium]